MILWYVKLFSICLNIVIFICHFDLSSSCFFQPSSNHSPYVPPTLRKFVVVTSHFSQYEALDNIFLRFRLEDIFHLFFDLFFFISLRRYIYIYILLKSVIYIYILLKNVLKNKKGYIWAFYGLFSWHTIKIY